MMSTYVSLLHLYISLTGVAHSFDTVKFYSPLLFVVVLSSYNHIFLCRKIRQYVYWKPEARRLLTEEEYQKQGEEETRRALEELRKYCNSPEFSPWKAVSRLQSPKRCSFPIPTYFCQKSLMYDRNNYILLIYNKTNCFNQ